jgi:hypothetical protein
MPLGQKQDVFQMFALFCSHERPDFHRHMTDKARSQATIDRLEGQLRELKRKVGLYKLHPNVAQLEIAPTQENNTGYRRPVLTISSVARRLHLW